MSDELSYSPESMAQYYFGTAAVCMQVGTTTNGSRSLDFVAVSSVLHLQISRFETWVVFQNAYDILHSQSFYRQSVGWCLPLQSRWPSVDVGCCPVMSQTPQPASVLHGLTNIYCTQLTLLHDKFMTLYFFLSDQGRVEIWSDFFPVIFLTDRFYLCFYQPINSIA